MTKKMFATIALLSAFAGCENKQEEPVAPEPTVAVRVQSPARTEYTGEGKLVYRKVDAIRIFSPFGVSPGEVIAAQKAMTITEGPTPGVNIAPVGVKTTADGGGTWSSGGFKRTWWDKIVSFFRKLKWMLIIGVVAGVGLYMWPVTRPIITSLGRIIASVIPVVGSAIEWLVGRFRTKVEAKHFTEVVSGGQRFKELLAADTMLNDEQKARVLELFKSAQMAAQDGGTQTAVRAAKA